MIPAKRRGITTLLSPVKDTGHERGGPEKRERRKKTILD